MARGDRYVLTPAHEPRRERDPVLHEDWMRAGRGVVGVHQCGAVSVRTDFIGTALCDCTRPDLWESIVYDRYASRIIDRAWYPNHAEAVAGHARLSVQHC